MKEDEKITLPGEPWHTFLLKLYLVYKINGNETAGHVARKGADRNICEV